MFGVAPVALSGEIDAAGALSQCATNGSRTFQTAKFPATGLYGWACWVCRLWRDLTEYNALSFDCYGTLIDWEAGIAAVLAPWAAECRLDLSDEELLIAYADNEAAIERETRQGCTRTFSPWPSAAPARSSVGQ